VFALGVLADAISAHRTVTQRTLERVRRIELQLGVPPSHYLPGRRGPVPETSSGSNNGAAEADDVVPAPDADTRAPG